MPGSKIQFDVHPSVAMVKKWTDARPANYPEGVGALSPGSRTKFAHQTSPGCAATAANVFESPVPQVKHGFSPRMRRPMVAWGEVRLCERNPWKHGNQILD